jgi:hypothetical protein
MTARDVAERVLAAENITKPDKAALADLIGTINSSPRNHGGKGVRRTNEGTEASITNKLKRGTFSATFFLAWLAAMELEGVVLEEI